MYKSNDITKLVAVELSIRVIELSTTPIGLRVSLTSFLFQVSLFLPLS